MITHCFTVYLDEKSHLTIAAEVREYEPAHGVWLVAGKCQRWRGRYEGQGLYTSASPLGTAYVIIARAETIEEALRALTRAAVAQGGDDA